ncbi:hypothetical protein DFJ77DRAFT_449360 [Powellomyces hirtus]|nr:hypothetical protein DFJ77DRAFT_449360 [Powellomyces hirtus]
MLSASSRSDVPLSQDKVAPSSTEMPVHTSKRPRGTRRHLPAEVILQILGDSSLEGEDYLPFLAASRTFRKLALRSLERRFMVERSRRPKFTLTCNDPDSSAASRKRQLLGPPRAVICELYEQDVVETPWVAERSRWNLLPSRSKPPRISDNGYLGYVRSHTSVRFDVTRGEMAGSGRLVHIELPAVSAGRHHLKSGNGEVEILIQIQSRNPSLPTGGSPQLADLPLQIYILAMWVTNGYLLAADPKTSTKPVVEKAKNLCQAEPTRTTNKSTLGYAPTTLESATWWATHPQLTSCTR